MISLLLALLLGTCGRAPKGDDRERLLRQEEIYQTAFENLDGALLERTVTEDYQVSYPEQGGTRDKQRFMDELTSMRAVFPELNLRLDSTRVEADQDGYVVTGTRVFNWQDGQATGEYREHYTNYWIERDGEWRLRRSVIEPRR